MAIQTARIESLVIENFGAFRRIQTFDNFGDLSAIVGGNGTGKSTIIDAIAFVLGHKKCTTSIRQNCRVSLKFKLTNRTLKSFTKQANGKSFKFYVNDKKVTKQSYVEELEEIGLEKRVLGIIIPEELLRNLTANRKMELTHFIERVSKSDELKENYNSLKGKLKAARKELLKNRNMFSKKTEMDSKKKEIKQKFELIKKERLSRFQKVFLQVSKEASSIFQKLYGEANATLTIEPLDAYEPYLGGLKICVGDEQDIMSMSSEKKVVVGLAFALAVNKCKMAPFLFVDDLDTKFSEKICGNVRSYLMAMPQNTCQIAVVSRNECFFKHVDSRIQLLPIKE